MMAFPKGGGVFNPGADGEPWNDPFANSSSSENEDEPAALGRGDWLAKFAYLDAHMDTYGSMSAAANMKPVCSVTTLRRRFANRLSGDIPLGAKPVLPPEAEKLLVDWIVMLYEHAFPTPLEKVRAKAKEFAVVLGGPEAAALVGGRRWLKLFLNRHPELKKMTSSNMESERVHAFSRESIARYQTLARIATEGLEPMNIYFTDEAWIEKNPDHGYKVSRLYHSDCLNLISPTPPPSHSV